jgi:hypothetical protein
VTCADLLTILGGTTYRWASPQVIIMAAAGVVFLVERRAAEPVLPLPLIAQLAGELQQLTVDLLRSPARLDRLLGVPAPPAPVP